MGGFKPNISPLVAEQMPMDRMYVRPNPKTGERELVDPAVTITRIYLYFYLFINVGALGTLYYMINWETRVLLTPR